MLQYPKGIRRIPKNRPVKVTYMYVPHGGDPVTESFAATKIVTARRIRRLMHEDGFEVVSRSCYDKRDRPSLKRFYVTIQKIHQQKPAPTE